MVSQLQRINDSQSQRWRFNQSPLVMSCCSACFQSDSLDLWFLLCLLQCIATIVILCIGETHNLINYVSFINYLSYGVTIAGLLYLRWKKPNLLRPIKVEPPANERSSTATEWPYGTLIHGLVEISALVGSDEGMCCALSFISQNAAVGHRENSTVTKPVGFCLFLSNWLATPYVPKTCYSSVTADSSVGICEIM